ncbi:MAG: hypothetical protein HYT22_00495 [Candidatus Niyogibacteria bacterium]|nr:hypothetical protein [Candidatus Niyogibacteria bacterium]
MAKKRGRPSKKEEAEEGNAWSRMNPETKQSIFAIASFAVAALLVLSAFGKAGVMGERLLGLFETLFGRAFFLVPVTFAAAGVSFLLSLKTQWVSSTVSGGILMLVSALAGFDILGGEEGAGVIGGLLSRPLLNLFDFWASLVILAAMFAVAVLLMMNISLKFRWPFGKKDEAAEGEGADATTAEKFKAAFDAIKSELTREKKAEEAGATQMPEPALEATSEEMNEDGTLMAPRRARPVVAFRPPPLDLLEDNKGRPNSGDIKANANIIKRTLQNFGILVEMAEVNIGPSITQYTMRPAEGVKLSKITGLHNDLALALAAHPIRIEAPIPGKSLVGIEIPNRSIALVGMRSMLASDDFKETKGELALSLGRDVSGRATYAVLEKMPHLLIAGSTGSGKSVAIHVMMMALLYRNPPERLRFLMIDPKRVELSVYSGIPHNLTSVITDPKKAIVALKWASREMERRYECLAKHKARDIGSYHAMAVSAEEPMPYIVIVIDELADIMTAYPREMEAAVVRLAQMSRAVGIHLVLSTQRPSVEVITGLIKANITSRIAFQVASQVDSRTILDMAGAEKLLGKGDMLFMSGDSAKPRRIQGAFVSESEVRKVAQYLENTYEAAETESFNLEPERESGTMFDGDGDDNAEDELYDQAKDIIIQVGKASASYLQRRLRIGYARAARLLDILEARGVIGPGDGAKPREVLLKADEPAPAIPKETAKKEDKNFFESF